MIEIIAGTNRPNSNAMRVAQLILKHYQELGRKAQILNLADLPQELFLPTAYAEKPASFQPIQDRISAAEGLHIVVPEYNGSFPGVLKYFIDMLKFPESFERRPVAFVGEAAGIWGAFRAVEQVQMIFGYRNALQLPERIWIPKIHQALTPEGELADAFVGGLLKDQVKKFADYVDAVRAVRP
jgi:NAD(P)H-dependent FMN reductase